MSLCSQTERGEPRPAPTHGIFNTAHDLIKKLALAGKKEGPAGAAGEAGEAGEAEGLEWQAEAAPQLCASSWQMPHGRGSRAPPARRSRKPNEAPHP